jgi:hypothetical protein
MCQIFDEIRGYGNKLFIGTQCPYCETILDESNFSIDHVIPKSSRISINDTGFNTMPACKDCNSLKQSEQPLNFLGFFDYADSKPIVKSEINQLSFKDYKVYVQDTKKGKYYYVSHNNKTVFSTYSKTKVDIFMNGIKYASN